MARGYLNQAELTAERFRPDPFRPGGRLYLTGDLARRSASGDLHFLGRLDHQDKIRGFRVELGEVQATLGRHPAVAEAVVLAHGEAADRRLVALFTTRAGAAEPADPSLLRAWLREQLPEHTVPAALVPLPALPLTPHGKVDLQALPEPAPGPAAEEHVAPSTPAEAALAGIWAEVLELPEVDVCSNLFDLGGHSLLATQVASRARDRLGAEVPLRAMFEHPTVAGLAATLEPAARGAGRSRRSSTVRSRPFGHLWDSSRTIPRTPRWTPRWSGSWIFRANRSINAITCDVYAIEPAAGPGRMPASASRA